VDQVTKNIERDARATMKMPKAEALWAHTARVTRPASSRDGMAAMPRRRLFYRYEVVKVLVGQLQKVTETHRNSQFFGKKPSGKPDAGKYARRGRFARGGVREVHASSVQKRERFEQPVICQPVIWRVADGWSERVDDGREDHDARAFLFSISFGSLFGLSGLPRAETGASPCKDRGLTQKTPTAAGVVASDV